MEGQGGGQGWQTQTVGRDGEAKEENLNIFLKTEETKLNNETVMWTVYTNSKCSEFCWIAYTIEVNVFFLYNWFKTIYTNN